MSQNKTLLTAAAYQKLKEQEKYWLEELKKIKRRYSQDVKGAGGGSASKDLAQEALRYTTQRLGQIQEILQESRIVGLSANKKKVGLGSRIEVLLDGQKQTLEIMSEFDSEPSIGKLSYVSPVAQALLGKKQSDKIKVQTPQGEIEITILKIL